FQPDIVLDLAKTKAQLLPNESNKRFLPAFDFAQNWGKKRLIVVALPPQSARKPMPSPRSNHRQPESEDLDAEPVVQFLAVPDGMDLKTIQLHAKLNRLAAGKIGVGWLFLVRADLKNLESLLLSDDV